MFPQKHAVAHQQTPAASPPKSPKSSSSSGTPGALLATKKLTPTQKDEIRALTQSEKEALIERINAARKMSTSNAISKSEALRPKFHYSETEQSYLLVDHGVINSTIAPYLGAVIEAISGETDIPVKVVSEASYEFSDDKQADDFLIGFIQGIHADHTYRPRLRTDKKNMDLGKATAFFLRVRGEVLKGGYTSVTLDGLKTYHAFFGNDPSRADGEEKQARMSPLYKVLQSMFLNVPSYQSRYKDYYDIIVSSLAYIGLKNFEDEEQRLNTIKHYMKSYDDIVHDFDQVAYSVDRKGKKKIVGTKRPRKPNPSPTLLSFEFTDFVDKIIGAHWQNLESQKKEFKDLVLIHGYRSAYQMVKSEYQARFESIRNYSNLTTKRLQEARAAGLLKPNSKKTDFTDAVRTDFLSRRDPDQRVELFYMELKRLIPPESRYSTLTRYLESISSRPENGTKEEVDKRMMYHIAVAYARHAISTGKFQSSIPKSDPVRGKEIHKTLENFSKVLELERTILFRLINLKELAFKRKEVVLRQKNYLLLKGELESLGKRFEDLSWTSKEANDLWELFYAQREGLSTPQKLVERVKSEIRTKLKELSSSSSRLSICFPSAPDRKDLLEDLEKKLAELKI